MAVKKRYCITKDDITPRLLMECENKEGVWACVWNFEKEDWVECETYDSLWYFWGMNPACYVSEDVANKYIEIGKRDIEWKETTKLLKDLLRDAINKKI